MKILFPLFVMVYKISIHFDPKVLTTFILVATANNWYPTQNLCDDKLPFCQLQKNTLVSFLCSNFFISSRLNKTKQEKLRVQLKMAGGGHLEVDGHEGEERTKSSKEEEVEHFGHKHLVLDKLYRAPESLKT